LEKAVINGFFEMMHSEKWDVSDAVKNAAHEFIKKHKGEVIKWFSDNAPVMSYLTDNHLIYG
jgi:hypothetical protein